MDYNDKYESITDETAIADALTRVIDSDAFKGSSRSKLLLEYVVEKYLNGEADQISGTAIAQDVLGYGADFDSGTNPVVRVQAGRMRKRLATYYRRSGNDDPVFIYVAKGQYAPQFAACTMGSPIRKGAETATPTPDAAQTIAPAIDARPFPKWLAASVLGVLLFVSGLFAIKQFTANTDEVLSIEQTVSTYPSIVILPFQNLTGDAKNDIFKQGFQHQLASDLYHFRVIRVSLSDLAHSQIINAEQRIAEYSLEGTFLSVDNEIDLVVRLIDLKTGETIRQSRISREIGDDSYFNALAGISSDLSSQFVGTDGVLVQQTLEEIGERLDLKNHSYKNMKSFECLALFSAFEADKTYENYQHADGCLMHQLEVTPLDASLLAAHAWIMVYGSEEWKYLPSEEVKDGYTLSKALSIAERAVALDPGNSRAYEYMALIQWKMGQKTAAIQSMKRSGKLNSAAPNYLANLGQFLSYSGDWDAGLRYSREAIARNPNAAYWYYTPLFIKAVMDKDSAKAVLYANIHGDFGGPDDGAYMLIAAAMTGDNETIARYTPIAMKHAKEHDGDALYDTRQWVQSPEIMQALEAELISIGMNFPNN